MPLAVDASVAFKWFVPESGDDEALALLDGSDPLWAPDLVLVEIGNALVGRLRPLENGFDVATTAFDRLGILYARLFPTAEFARRALELSFELSHPIYDCVYLALVERENIELLTADERFIRAVAGTEHGRRVRALEARGE